MTPMLLFALLSGALLPTTPSVVVRQNPTPSTPPSAYAVLVAEHQRGRDMATLRAAAASGDTLLQRLAARAIGRIERGEHEPLLRPLYRAASPAIRREAINAAAQMKRIDGLPALLGSEQEPTVRAAILEAWGRVATADAAAEAAFTRELGASSLVVRRGAARALESYVRRNARSGKPQAATVTALRQAIAASTDGELRLLALLALTAGGDRDSMTTAVALRDASSQVRRAAVAYGRVWHADTAAMVRWQALRVAGNCDRAAAHMRDPSTHVALLAIDLLGELGCSPAPLDAWFRTDTPWRQRAHATVAAARLRRPEASAQIRRLAADPVWQARAWAANAAQQLGDTLMLRQLARDSNPNVAIAALRTVPEALRALTASHAGLVLAGATRLKGVEGLATHRPAMRASFDRLTRSHGPTWRDPRQALLERMSECADQSDSAWLASHLADRDPAIAALAASILTRISGAPVAPRTTALAVPPFPRAEELAVLQGATATVFMRGVGTIVVRLLPEEAPASVHSFVQLARGGKYNGNTIHRIVPNFVIQGGSPGADEYDPVTTEFMRDEVGYARQARGTFGISTRGRDTGDGQLYINLVDNIRLDHDYTVFAETTRGLDVVDAIQEGDVIDSIVISSTATRAPDEPSSGVRHPAVGSTGMLVYEMQGHLVSQQGNEAPRQLTTGSAWHRDPSWSGDTLYFASDASGHYAVHRGYVDNAGRLSAIERLTTGASHDVAPDAAGGQMVFQRGLGNDARIWILQNGTPARLTAKEQTERRPRLSSDGTRVAFIRSGEDGRRIVVQTIATGRDTVVFSDASLEDVAWAPDDRLAVSVRSGTYVIPSAGSAYTAMASRSHGDLAWSADGWLTIAEYRDATVSYNGDPDRGVDRSANERHTGGAVIRVMAPTAPDAQRAEVVTARPADRIAANATAFDRIWERSQRLYFTSAEAAERRTRWNALRERYRPQALAATSDSALQSVLHQLLAARPPLRTEATGRAAVSSAHPVATAAGLEIFRNGGNVVDAAVAVSFALGVVEPDASGIGGYGEMVIARAGQPTPTLIEFMSRVPEEGGLGNSSLLVNGRYPSDGPVLTNVPGTVAGMYKAWQQYGSKRVTWAALLAPAIRAAREGYAVSDGLATTLSTEREHFAKYEGSRALFFRDGSPRVQGDTIRNPDLAWVLEQIAAKGADGFYKGPVAERWVQDLRGKGNAMKLSDLARYFANERAPVSGSYRGYTIYSSAPPVSGGAELVARLNLLEQHAAPKRYTEDAATLHAALSAWFLTPSSRNRIADPALWPVDVASIVDKDTARVRWRCFTPDAALTPSAVRGDTLPCLTTAGRVPVPAEGRPGTPPMDALEPVPDNAPCGDDHAAEMAVCHAAGTTAFTVADAEGNVVAVTQTLGTWGGTFYVTPGLGFLSNDKLTSYGTDPSQYGSRLPFARHGSTLAPTIAFKGARPVFAVGAAGNAWITSAVYQTLLGALDYQLGPQAALELPRFLPGGGASAAGARASAAFTLQLEDGFAPQVLQRLRALGYDLSFVSARGELREGYGAAIRLNAKSVTAGADPRRAGAAGAIIP